MGEALETLQWARDRYLQDAERRDNEAEHLHRAMLEARVKADEARAKAGELMTAIEILGPGKNMGEAA